MTNKHVTATGHTVETVGVWQEKQRSGAIWTMFLEKYITPSGKSSSYLIYHVGGQSHPVGSFRSLRGALKILNSFSSYKKVAA